MNEGIGPLVHPRTVAIDLLTEQLLLLNWPAFTRLITLNPVLACLERDHGS